MADYERDLVPVPRLSIRPLLSLSSLVFRLLVSGLFLSLSLSHGDSWRFQIAPPTLERIL